MPGLINLDFADVRAIMKDAGSALMGIGRATGENRAVEAARQAIASPLLEVNIQGAQGILFNITGSSNLSLFEVTEAAEEIRAAADPEANIIFGTSFNERLGDEVMITVIATGFDGGRKREPRPARPTGRHGQLDRPSGRRRASATSSRSSSASATRSPRRLDDGSTRLPNDDTGSVAATAPSAVGRRAAPRQARRRPTTPRTSRSRASSAASDARRRRAGGRPMATSRPTSSAFAPPAGRSSRAIASRVRARRPIARRTSTLVAVSKTVPAERLRAAVAAGLTSLGENRVQEGRSKVAEVPGATWHLVGPLQSNKARRALEIFESIKSVDSVDLAERLDRLVAEVRPGGRFPVLLQVNVDDDPSKAGFAPAELEAALGAILDLPRLEVRGLMTIGRSGRSAPRHAAHVRRRCASSRSGCAPQMAASAGAVDGHERRLRGRGRGGRDDRPGRAGAVRRAAARPRPRARGEPPTATEEGSRPADAPRGAGRLGRVEFRLGAGPRAVGSADSRPIPTFVSPFD